jgi:hypothetical protein
MNISAFLDIPKGFQRIVCTVWPRLSISCSVIDRPENIMTIMHFFLLGRDPFSDQLRDLPLKVNQVPSRPEFQRRESKSRYRPNVHFRVNQNSANRGLPLLSRDVTRKEPKFEQESAKYCLVMACVWFSVLTVAIL